MQYIEIHIQGEINEQWSEWFGGLAVSHSGPGETILTGLVQDQSALFGIIARLRDLGLPLSMVHCEEAGGNWQG